jgi:hypothetical protein
MLKLAMAIAAAAALAIAGPTTIAQSKITNGNGQGLATGTITVTASVAFLAADGTWVDTTPLIVAVINGGFSTQLEPNDTGTPFATYTAVWQLNGARPRTESWMVPTSNLVIGLSGLYRQTTTTATYASLLPRDYSIDITSPQVTDTGIWQYQSSLSYLVAGVSCTTDTGTVTINLDVRAPGAPNTPGTNVLPASLVCTGTGTAAEQPTSAVTIPAGAPVNLQILATSGTPGVVRVYVQTN